MCDGACLNLDSPEGHSFFCLGSLLETYNPVNCLQQSGGGDWAECGSDARKQALEDAVVEAESVEAPLLLKPADRPQPEIVVLNQVLDGILPVCPKDAMHVLSIFVMHGVACVHRVHAGECVAFPCKTQRSVLLLTVVCSESFVRAVLKRCSRNPSASPFVAPFTDSSLLPFCTTLSRNPARWVVILVCTHAHSKQSTKFLS